MAEIGFPPLTQDHISQEALIEQMNKALQVPRLSNAWTMPIKGRIDRLTTEIRTPVGLKISGADLNAIEQIGAQIESLLSKVKGTRSVFAERTGGGYFLDVYWNLEALGRYGLSVSEAQEVIQTAIGGENVTTTVQGKERYPVNVRYVRDFRSDFGALGRVLVPAGEGKRQLPLSQLASIEAVSGPSMIRDEDGMLTGYVYVDIAGRDPNNYIVEAGKLLRENVEIPPGHAISWNGRFEAMQRVRQRLAVVPVTVFLIFVLIYLNTRSFTKTMIVLLAVPFSATGLSGSCICWTAH
jgi:Cu(I)/Ag(I) efflux system membrane protein CusA/SilA